MRRWKSMDLYQYASEVLVSTGLEWPDVIPTDSSPSGYSPLELLPVVFVAVDGSWQTGGWCCI